MSFQQKINAIRDLLIREVRIMVQRPIYIVASVAVMIFNIFFYLTLMQDGLPHDLPIGVVDLDNSSTSRSFSQQLDATQLGAVVKYTDLHEARIDMQRGHINGYVLIPEGFNADIQANRRPTMSYYVNTLYFVGGSLAWKDMLQMINLTNGAVQRQVLRAKGVNDAEIMNRIQPIRLDQHQIGNVTTHYNVYLCNILLPGILQMIVILITIYTLGTELKYGTSKHLMRSAGDSIEVALLGKLIPYTLIFTVLGIITLMVLYVWMNFPLAGSIGNMFIAMLLLVASAEAVGIFIVSMIPVLRLAISIGAIYSVLAFSLTGFTLPVQVMPTYIQSFSMAFPLRHYYLFYVQEAIFASGFAGWWKEVIHLLVFLVLPPLSMWRLADAYRHQNYKTE